MLHALTPSSTIGKYVQIFRNTWPWKRLIGEPPNFEYEDPREPGKMRKVLLKVQPAREPDDYIWMHMCAATYACAATDATDAAALCGRLRDPVASAQRRAGCAPLHLGLAGCSRQRVGCALLHLRWVGCA